MSDPVSILEPGAICGHCHEHLGVLVDCLFEFAWPDEAIGITYFQADPDHPRIGVGSGGVRVTSRDGRVIHECGEPKPREEPRP